MSKSSRRRARVRARKQQVQRKLAKVPTSGETATKVKPAAAAKAKAPDAPEAEIAAAAQKPVARPEVTAIGGIALGELTALLGSPLGWGLGAAFTVLVSVFGFIGPVLSSQQARIDGVFGVIAGYAVVVLAPLVTTLGVEERLTSWQLAVGKWLGDFAFYVLLVATTLVYVAVVEDYARGGMDVGLLAASYAGLLLVGAAAIAIAVLAGSFARRRSVAFACGLAALVVIWFGGYFAGPVTQNRYQSYGLGVVSLRDTVFFLSLAAGALLVATPLVKSKPFPVGALVLALVVAVNVVAARGTVAFDVTGGRLNTLSPPSVSAAGQLRSDLSVIGLFRAGSSDRADAEALVRLYQSESPHVAYREADYDTDISDVRQFAVKEPDTLVLELAGMTQLLPPAMQTEQDFTAAVLQLESGRAPLICWSVGAGGRSLGDADQSSGYSGVATLLSRDDFATRDLSIMLISSIPSDCDVVALVGSTAVLPAPAVTALDGYLAAGGSLLIAADPWNQNPAATASLSSVLKPYGFSFSGALVVETDTSRAFDLITPAVLDYGSSPISRDIHGVAAFFPQTTPITGTPHAGATAVVIGATSSRSYAIASPRQALQRQTGDVSGPFALMEMLQLPAGEKTARIIMVGTAGFAENRVLPPTSNDANFELTLATFGWLAGQDSLLTVPRKAPRGLPLSLTQQDESAIIFITAVLMPGLMVLGGVMVWWRRRTTLRQRP